jgi:leader peptidase (prepilin peptidase)/N-methyltransferase
MDIPSFFLIAMAVIIGLVIGSFLNVVAYRVPLGLSVVKPPSACPVCDHQIRWYDNIPVIGWMRLGGKCRDCDSPISGRYPLVEAGTGVSFGLVSWLVGPTALLTAYLFFAATTIALVLTDIDHKRLPDRIVFTGTGLTVALFIGGSLIEGQTDQLVPAFIGGAAYLVLFFALFMLTPGGFGFGDVKLSFLLGFVMAYSGWEELVVGVFLAFLIGGLIGTGIILFTKRGRKTKMPFGPAMMAGAWLGALWGSGLATWYLGL